MNDNSLSIRPALPDDSQAALPLIRLSMGAEVDWLFGQEKNHPTDHVVEALFGRNHNRASHDACWLAEQGGKIVGLLVAFPGNELHPRDLWTGWQLVRIFGLPATLRLARRQTVYGSLIEADADEFYVSNLAVDPGCQGSGIGTRMLSFCDELAGKKGFGKCSLIVTYDNPARRLYERWGYKIIHSYDIPHPVIAHGSGGYHRMVKVIGKSLLDG
jgi:ribosomal protein S18 acetylase RimI-like enzyme